MSGILRLLIGIILYTCGLLLIEWVNPDGFTWFDFITDFSGLMIIILGGIIQCNG